MISFSTPAPTVELAAAYTILAALGDPVGSKAKLDALVAATADAKATVEAAQDAQASADASIKELAAKTEAFTAERQKLDAARALNDDRGNALDLRESDLNAKLQTREELATQKENALVASVKSTTANLASQAASLNASAKALADRESKVLERENGITQREDALAAQEGDYQQRMAKLKALTS